jgi:hypothetical protein
MSGVFFVKANMMMCILGGNGRAGNNKHMTRERNDINNVEPNNISTFL